MQTAGPIIGRSSLFMLLLQERRYASDADHNEMRQFCDESDSEYQTVYKAIEDTAVGIKETIQRVAT